jgi:hypothetical protein
MPSSPFLRWATARAAFRPQHHTADTQYLQTAAPGPDGALGDAPFGDGYGQHARQCTQA